MEFALRRLLVDPARRPTTTGIEVADADVDIAAAQFEAIGGGSSYAAKVVLAAVVGLVFVGLMLVLAAVITRWRTGGLVGREVMRGR